MAQVELQHLTKHYEENALLPSVNDVSFIVNAGEFVVLVGPSGCGKSTTLRMIAGLETPTSGNIIIDGVEMTHVAPKDRDIAMVFQNYALYPHMSVAENLGFALSVRGMKKKEIAERVEEVAETLSLKSLLTRKPKALSGGERQRVALGRAIIRKPKVFLFDEPLSNLDAALRAQLRTEIARLHRTLGVTMIYVTHDQTEAMTLGNRIVVLERGVVQQIGTPIELYTTPRNIFVAGFIGNPPMNFINGTIIEAENSVFFIERGANGNRVRVELKKSFRKYLGTNLTLGVRPEHIKLVVNGESNPCQAILDLVEPLGSESILRLRTPNDRELRATVVGLPRLKLRSKIKFTIAGSDVLLFDDHGIRLHD